jgi:hypothetical protein
VQLGVLLQPGLDAGPPGGLGRALQPVGGELLVGNLAVREEADIGVAADEGVERERATCRSKTSQNWALLNCRCRVQAIL